MGAPRIAPPFEQVSDKFVLTGRKVLQAFDHFAGPPGLVSGNVVYAEVPFGTNTAGSPFGFTIAQADAVRIVKGSWCNCFGNPQSTFLTCESLAIQLISQPTQIPLRTWAGNYSGDVLGANGAYATIQDDELIKGDDFRSFIRTDKAYGFALFFDVLNSDVAAHSFGAIGVIQVEFWSLSTTSRMRG
jgi:hypothetical protein